MLSRISLSAGLRFGLLASLAILLGVPIYALPATLSLGPGRRPGLGPLTIEEAADQLRVSGKQGWVLVEAARALVSERMHYSRRNSFDLAPRAFERGYGYCQQMAFALAGLLENLGFEAHVVQALHNRFPDGTIGGHAWVRVTVDGQTRYIDALYYDVTKGRIGFKPLSRVTEVGPLFRIFAGWGSVGVNAYRYYKTGRDS